MEERIEQDEIRPLIFNYVLHFILFFLEFLLHLIISSKLYWIYQKYYILFLFGSSFSILFFIFPLFPIIIILYKKFKINIFQALKLITLVFFIISIIIGLLISIIILINTLLSKTFCKECPFSITISHLNYIFEKYYDKYPREDEIKDLCKSRRCILDEVNNNDQYPYKYLCNYNPIFELNEKKKDIIYKRNSLNGKEITSDKQINCDLVGVSFRDLSLKHNELYKYLTICYYKNDFYYCGRFDKPEKVYNIDNEDTCPEIGYLFLLYVICAFIILYDVVIIMIPWMAEYISIKRIVRLMMNVTRRKANSHNSTQKSSVITKNEEIFKRTKTLIIISPSRNEEDIITVKKSLCIQDNNSINNEENRNIVQPIKNVQNSERTKINNSINVFEKNKQNNKE